MARIGSFELLGQTLSNVFLDAAPIEEVWRVNGHSDQFIGHVDFYPDWDTQGVKVVAQKLDLAIGNLEESKPGQKTDAAITVDPANSSPMTSVTATDPEVDASTYSSSDLPSDSNVDLPTYSSVELPSGSKVDVPAYSSVELPSDSEVDLPTYSSVELPNDSKVGVPAYSSADLPADPEMAVSADSSPQLSTDSTDSTVNVAVNLPANLPPIAIDAEDFMINGKSFGTLVLQGTPVGEDYKIQILSIKSKDINIQGDGLWRRSSGKNVSEMNFTLDASKFDILTGKIGIDPGVKDAPLNFIGDISWPGAPYEFVLGNLNGKASFELGKGNLTEISDRGARIFSLFSLDSLVRRLSLDFSDVFGSGLYFNSFKGSLDLNDGLVKTSDTEMDALIGQIKIKGYTDLKTQRLNYDIRLIPQLVSSVPALVLLGLGPAAWPLGLGAFALTKVLNPVMAVISELRYKVTGTMDDPKVTEVGRESKKIEIPMSKLPLPTVEENQQPVEGVDGQVQQQSLIEPEANKTTEPLAIEVQPAQSASAEKEAKTRQNEQNPPL